MTNKSKYLNQCMHDIQRLNRNLRKIGKRVTPDIVGFYGELLVWEKLESYFAKRGYAVKAGGGQTKADFSLIKDGQQINIEVKTSRRKNEWYGEGYGYALNIKRCKKHPDKYVPHPKKGKVSGDFCYFDYLIAVLLSRDLKICKFYVFPVEFIKKHEKDLRNLNKRFSSATHRMVFVEKERKTSEITKFDRFLKKNKRKYKNAWHLIK